MAKKENYVALRIGYQDYLLPIEQAQAVQRELLGAVVGNTAYPSKPNLVYGWKQVTCELRLLDEPPLIAPLSEEASVANYVTCVESAHALDSTARFHDYETWKKEVV